MPLGSRTRRAKQIDGRRCCKCKKVAKDLNDGEYLCRIHSQSREGFMTAFMQDKKKKSKEDKD